MNRDLNIFVIILGVMLALLEIYIVKKKKKNRWTLPVIVWAISLITAIPYSLTLVLFPSLLQGLMVICFYIEEYIYGGKNKDVDKIKIKNL